MTTRADIIDAIQACKTRVDGLANGIPEDRWAAGVYHNGWSARELLAHVASTSAPCSFIANLASLPAGGGMPGGAFDNDAFNAQQVAMRESKIVRELADEVMMNCQRDIQTVEGAPDDLLAKHFKAPWDVEGTVAEVMLASVTGHYGTHIDEIATAIE